MAKSKRRPSSCRGCGRHESEAGPISRGGLCGDCAIDRLSANLRGMREQAGPEWDRWRLGMSAAAQRPGRR